MVVVILFSNLSLSAEEPQTPWLIANRCHNWVKVCNVSTHLSLSYSLTFKKFSAVGYQIKTYPAISLKLPPNRKPRSVFGNCPDIK